MTEEIQNGLKVRMTADAYLFSHPHHFMGRSMSIEIDSYAGPIGEELLTQGRQCLQFNLTSSHSLKLLDLKIPIYLSKLIEIGAKTNLRKDGS